MAPQVVLILRDVGAYWVAVAQWVGLALWDGAARELWQLPGT